MAVYLTPQAEAEIDALAVTPQLRIRAVVTRLERWPEVSGAKALKHEWVGHFRIRTGDYRVIFRVEGVDVTVVHVEHRSRVYGD